MANQNRPLDHPIRDRKVFQIDVCSIAPSTKGFGLANKLANIILKPVPSISPRISPQFSPQISSQSFTHTQKSYILFLGNGLIKYVKFKNSLSPFSSLTLFFIFTFPSCVYLKYRAHYIINSCVYVIPPFLCQYKP